jgi:signal transduction histidine kinase
MSRRTALIVLAVLVAAGIALPPVLLLALVPLWFLGADLRVAVGAAAVIVLVEALWATNATAPVAMAVLCAGVITGARFQRLRRASGARERELLAEAAANEERLRIARELHDAVGHDVSLMVVQAEALAAVTGDERADAIAAQGRRAMGELHRTLKVLRDDASHAPAPGLDDLALVLQDARAAGVPITLAVEGAPRALAAGLDASAYRIVQEAVTNVIRHAGGAPASVTVHYGTSTLQLVIADEGRPSVAAPNGGHGLVGMRERVSAFGGTLDAGPRDRGFVVRAELPYA